MKRGMVGVWVASMLASHGALASEGALPEPPQAGEQGRHDDSRVFEGGHRRERVYLGLSAGFGPLLESMQSSGPRGEITGFGNVSSLAIGYHVAPSLMLGGMVHASTMLASNFHPTPNAEELPQELDPSRRNVFFVGPYLHWHPKLDVGWYWQVAVGAAQLDTNGYYDRYTATGGGARLGVGYEWFRRDGFYLGALASSEVAVLRGVDEQRDVWWHVHSTGVSLSVTASYN